MAKARANRRLYIEILRGMTPEQRLRKAFELTDMVQELARAGLKRRHRGLDASSLAELTRERLMRWHSRSS